MANYNLYVDCDSGELVQGTASATPAVLPRFFQGDTISLRIYLLQRTATYPAVTPYAVISNATLSLKVAIGTKAGSTIYASQDTWAKDAGNQYFYALLDLDVAAVDTLIGATEQQSAWFEVQYEQGGDFTTVFQKQVEIHAEVIS